MRAPTKEFCGKLRDFLNLRLIKCDYFKVGSGSDWNSTGDGSLADEAFEELFRSKEIGLEETSIKAFSWGINVCPNIWASILYFVRNLTFVIMWSEFFVWKLIKIRIN